MRIEVVRLPSELKPEHLHDRVVVVFDVLRATTTIVAALANGAREIRVFDSLQTAKDGARESGDARLLCGEVKCLPAPGFDLGNSPGDYTPQRVAGKTLLMSTTNGTLAIVAARPASATFAAALVNVSATARYIGKIGSDVTLLCAGTDGQVAPEDLIGAGAVAEALDLSTSVKFVGIATHQAMQLFNTARHRLEGTLRDTQGGRNVIAAGLSADIEFAAQLDRFDLVATVTAGSPPIITRAETPLAV